MQGLPSCSRSSCAADPAHALPIEIDAADRDFANLGWHWEIRTHFISNEALGDAA
jgi:hypothetical protein